MTASAVIMATVAMISTTRRSWLRTPRRSLVMFVGVATMLGLALGWFAWRFINESDRSTSRRTAARLNAPTRVSAGELRQPDAELAAAADKRRFAAAALVAFGLIATLGSVLIAHSVKQTLVGRQRRTELVAAVSHEFRTPLTSIAQASEALLDGRVPEDSRRQYYRILVRDAERVRMVLNAFMDYSRSEADAFEYPRASVSVATLVYEVAEAFTSGGHGGGHQLDIDDAAAVPIAANREALGRAVWNLLDNAAKYSPACEPIVIGTAFRNGRVQISVRDRGIGVVRADQERIFEPFFRGNAAASTGASGSGLGLAVARHVARAHGGDVTVESTHGQGSTFTISLPLYFSPTV